MQGPAGSSGPPRPEAILEWLQKEMGYQGPIPSADQLRNVCRGNMVPVWDFLLRRVRSERTVGTARRNMMVHGVAAPAAGRKGRGRAGGGEDGSGVEAREAAVRERDLAEEEAERMRGVVRRQRRELRARMMEVAREESERKRVLDERANARHKQVMLEAYDQQCDEAAKIFAEYQKRLHHYVNQARDVRRSSSGGLADGADELMLGEKEAVYSTVKGNKSSDDLILIETSRERNIRRACEILAANMIEKIRIMFPAYEGSGININSALDAAKLGIDIDGEIPDDVTAVSLEALKNPSLMIQSITLYTSRVNTLIHRETEKIDIRADAELLRYKYENDRVIDADASPDSSSPLPYQVYGNGKTGTDLPTKGTYNQLLERQKAHVQQFVATEDALNKAAEAKSLSLKLIKRLHGNNDMVASHITGAGGTSTNVSNMKHFELDVWAKEREVAGLKASLSTLTSEVQRLNKLCTEWKEAEESLKKKWKKIEEFDARRSELECIYTALLRASMDASAYWEQQPSAAREYATRTIIPACTAVMELSNNAKDLIENEVSAFYQSLDNSLYMLPSTPQALLESMGIGGATGSEAVVNAEKNAALLTARAGARDPSAIPSICRISAALQSHGGTEGSDTGLASVLESLEFCLKLRGSEASILEDLSKAINLVRVRRDLVENDRVLLNHAHRVQQEYERMANYCLKVAAEQEKGVTERWLPELRNAVLEAQRGLEDCLRVRGLVDEWWEQPAATAVDWITVEGQNVGAWLNHVKQLQMAFYDQELL
ncbi:HAUS augmin-like complex subunit 5 protein [Dioscorea alata]|uniref:HAUS augmin-like complex subunit 5 protein n=1 Tax=Dioscorea alata TaxID=55571 RepID=A0ACB7WLX8_DIOAL|nr:HAUS augmin-like complex subunit 5 protein [Dioscorea alata]